MTFEKYMNMSKKVFEGKPIPFMSPQTPLY